MKKIFIVFAVCAVTFGCATSEQQIDLHAPAMNTWVGAPIEEFLDMQGAPSAVIEKDDYQIFRFNTSKTKTVTDTGRHCQPTNFNEPINDYGQPAGCTTVERHVYTVRYTCAYGLVVVEDVITYWSMVGNSCNMMTVHARPRQAETG